MDAIVLKTVLRNIRDDVIANKDLLTQLDSVAGDGDLGISMAKGFEAVCRFVDSSDERDVGKLLVKSGMTLNNAAPSTLGTILSIGPMSGGKQLLGKMDIDIQDGLSFFQAALMGIMDRAHSAVGEKTILDALYPAYEAMKDRLEESGDAQAALLAAAEAAHEGMLKTVNMRAVHGRAAYYADESMNHQDGGATVGSLIVRAIADSLVVQKVAD